MGHGKAAPEDAACGSVQIGVTNLNDLQYSISEAKKKTTGFPVVSSVLGPVLVRDYTTRSDTSLNNGFLTAIAIRWQNLTRYNPVLPLDNPPSLTSRLGANHNEFAAGQATGECDVVPHWWLVASAQELDSVCATGP